MTRDEFIESNLPLVHKMANRFRGRGVEYEELYAAGCVGLVKAADRFEPERGLCFSTYAVPVILGEIRRLFRDGGSVKISRSLKELSVKAARVREQLAADSPGGEPRISDIAQALGVTPEEAAEALCAGIPPVSLDHGGEDGEPLPVPSASGEEALIDRLALRQCLSELPAEDREILLLRYFRRKTQCETAQILGMTQVMVSRRERKLLSSLREQLV
ncbi:MAG: sigma-70 family RNA polymerase sigma factor [Oscillospiraceae bacterium]|nr:sigma-70 family RNA polymerase sigma factor [Oscillospiraceae bacterium]